MVLGLTTFACDSDKKDDASSKDTAKKEAKDKDATKSDAKGGEAKGGETKSDAATKDAADKPAPAGDGGAVAADDPPTAADPITPTPAAEPPALAAGTFGCSFRDSTGSYNRRCKVTADGDGKWKVSAPGTKLNPDNGFNGTLSGGPDSFQFEGRVSGFDNCRGNFSATANRDGERLVAKATLGSGCPVTVRIKVGPRPTAPAVGGGTPAGSAAGALLTIRLTPAPADSGRAYNVDSTPAPSAKPLAGLDAYDCDRTSSLPPPCGWASQCADLGRRWGKQIGADEAGEVLGTDEYMEDCGDDGDIAEESSSEDFVDHAGVIKHRTGALADDGVSGIMIQKMSGWHGVARVREVAIEGMSVKRVHEPVASWAMDLDGKPGHELAVLVTGLEDSGSGMQRSARLVVCRTDPEVGCRRLDLGNARTVEVRSGGMFVVDGGAAKTYESLDRADQRLIGSGGSAAPAPTGGGNARCLVTSGSESYDGRCTFKPDGGTGSFSITPVGEPDFFGANPLMVSIAEPGVAEVRGLTKDGISSRWGEAKRSATDRACWDGDDFSICAYGGK
ncbi:MAG: hypothetical protein AAF799_20485 [Myxococcota bacterium]